MEGELPPVVVEFQANIEPLVAQMQELVDQLQETAASGEETDATLQQLAATADEISAAVDNLDGSLAGADASLSTLSVSAEEATVSLEELSASQAEGIATNEAYLASLQALSAATDNTGVQSMLLAGFLDGLQEAITGTDITSTSLSQAMITLGGTIIDNDGDLVSYTAVLEALTAVSEGADGATTQLAAALVGAGVAADDAMASAELLTGTYGELAVAIEADNVAMAQADTEAAAGGIDFGGLAAGIQGAADSASILTGIILLLIPLIFALVGVVATVGAAFLAFGILAIPTILAVKNAWSDSQAQLAKLSPTMQEIISGAHALVNAYKAMAAALQPAVLLVLAAAIKAVNAVLPILADLAKAAAPLIAGMFNEIAKAVSSQGFKDSLNWFIAHLPEAFHLFEELVSGIGKFIEAFVRIGVIIAPIVFAVFGEFFKIITGIMNYLADHPELAKLAAVLMMVAGAVIILLAVLAPLFLLFGGIGAVVALVIIAIIALVAAIVIFHHQIEEAFDAARHAVAAFADEVAKTFEQIGQNIARYSAEYLHLIMAAWDAIAKATRTAWDDVVKFISSALSQASHNISAVFDTIMHTIESAWDTVLHATTSFLSNMEHYVMAGFDAVKNFIVSAGHAILQDLVNAWNSAYNAVVHGVTDVVNFVRTLPGKIVAALASLAGLLFQIGVNALEGLLNGLVSMGQRILGWVEGFAHSIGSVFSHILSIFSPSRVFYSHGQNILLGLIGGMQSLTPQALDHISGLAQGIANNFNAHASASISASTYASNAASHSGSGGDIVVAVDGRQLLRVIGAQAYQYNIRNSGQVTGVLKPS